MKKKRVFSGVQPTGNLHLGNYLGALKNFVNLQKSGDECIYCVVDLHAITVKTDPEQLKQNTLEIIASFLAAGLDYKKSIIFNQSSVGAHAEFAWILNCISRVGWMNRMTQFKEKAGSNKENASVGLYIYPTLMAADILLYNATHVPVGDDQKQHLELTRDIAQKFNNDFNCDGFITIPEPLIQKEFSRIMSLKDGKNKMSKSDPSDPSRINLKDDKDTIVQKIKKAKTDSLPVPSNKTDLNSRPEAENLINIYSSLSDQSLDKTLSDFGGKNFSFLKDKLTELLISKIWPLGQEIKKLLKDKKYLNSVLKEGSQKAGSIANNNLKKIYEKVGLSKFKI